jgi:hypothetical protein
MKKGKEGQKQCVCLIIEWLKVVDWKDKMLLSRKPARADCSGGGA